MMWWVRLVMLAGLLSTGCVSQSTQSVQVDETLSSDELARIALEKEKEGFEERKSAMATELEWLRADAEQVRARVALADERASELGAQLIVMERALAGAQLDRERTRTELSRVMELEDQGRALLEDLEGKLYERTEALANLEATAGVDLDNLLAVQDPENPIVYYLKTGSDDFLGRLRLGNGGDLARGDRGQVLGSFFPFENARFDAAAQTSAFDRFLQLDLRSATGDVSVETEFRKTLRFTQLDSPRTFEWDIRAGQDFDGGRMKVVGFAEVTSPVVGALPSVDTGPEGSEDHVLDHPVKVGYVSLGDWLIAELSRAEMVIGSYAVGFVGITTTLIRLRSQLGTLFSRKTPPTG